MIEADHRSHLCQRWRIILPEFVNPHEKYPEVGHKTISVNNMPELWIINAALRPSLCQKRPVPAGSCPALGALHRSAARPAPASSRPDRHGEPLAAHVLGLRVVALIHAQAAHLDPQQGVVGSMRSARSSDTEHWQIALLALGLCLRHQRTARGLRRLVLCAAVPWGSAPGRCLDHLFRGRRWMSVVRSVPGRTAAGGPRTRARADVAEPVLNGAKEQPESASTRQGEMRATRHEA